MRTVPTMDVSTWGGGVKPPNVSKTARKLVLTRLRLHFSALNEHRFRHAFDCITPVCICGLANEDNEHFFLHCPLYHGLRVDLFDQISDIPGIDLTYFDESSLCNLLLYGSPSCTEIHNSIIIESTKTYINATGRFI